MKKFSLETTSSIRTPMSLNIKLTVDMLGKSVDPSLYRGMIGSLLYLTASIPDISYSVGMCARYQANPKESRMTALKRIIKYVKIIVNHVPKIEFPYYPSYEHMRTVSKDELMSSFCERPIAWCERLFTLCRPFAKGPRFMNMVMTFVLHPLSHYNSITEPCARFLLSLLEHLTIDFPSHFILSIIDVHLDSTSRDKLIFPSAITRILHHFFVPFLLFNHFSIMCVIDYDTIKRSEAQFRPRQTDSAAPSSRSAPSRSTPSALPLLMMYLWEMSWCSCSAWMLASIHSLRNCIR